MEKPKNREHGKSSEGLSKQTRAKSSEFLRQSLPISREMGQFRPLSKQSGRPYLGHSVFSRISASLWRGVRGIRGIILKIKF